ncbi:hypothetical protein FBY35_2629 [Streptomyces sp. SLBN-118]|nr:hypothetical protein FBY35_2629 [Streptomyces sp. SLBN-118]
MHGLHGHSITSAGPSGSVFTRLPNEFAAIGAILNWGTMRVSSTQSKR